MKVEIGEYPDWVGPYQVADKLFFFLSEDKREKIGDWIPAAPFEWYHKWFKSRHVEVKIDKWDTWSVDHTLALIIHPLLVKFRENMNGWPMNIDSADVPDSVWSDLTAEDDIREKQWQWLVDEMIWGFSQIIDEDADLQFFSEDENGKSKCDIEGMKKWSERINRSTLLFGKYYQNLWT